MLTFIKFGGSIITDKRGQETANLPRIKALAAELHTIIRAHPERQFLIGHGSGSFGHAYAARYGLHRGIAPGGDWMGFALTSAAALRLNRIMVDQLLQAGVPAFALQPSASLHSQGGVVTHWQVDTIIQALDHGLVPVIHGDVAFDNAQGSAIISTEALFTYLALHTPIRPRHIVLVGEDAIYTTDPHLDPDALQIALIDSTNIDEVLHGAGDSHAIDVTGGMRSKLEAMWHIAQTLPGTEIQLIGPTPGLLTRALLGEAAGEGTLIRL